MRLARALLNNLKNSRVDKISEEFNSEIQKMAHATAVLRTPVGISFWRYEVNDALTPSVEIPTRLAKELLKLAYALAFVRGKTEVTAEEIRTVRRVARDTAYPNRIAIVSAMEMENQQYTTREIAEVAAIPLSTCWRELKELQYLGVVSYKETEKSDGYRTKHTPERDGWTLKGYNSLRIILPKRSLKWAVSLTSSKGGNTLGGKGKASLGFSETSNPRKVCGQCAWFRTPKCGKENWESRNGNASAVGEWCFKPK